MRRWADAGEVRSFRTPGGHRRFSAEDLQILLAGPRPEEQSSQFDDLGSVALTRIRRQLQRGRDHEAPWYATVDVEARERLRPLGRRLVSLVSQSVGRRNRKRHLLAEARQIGVEYGQELAVSGLSLHDAIEALTFFRKNLDGAAKQVAQRGQAISTEDVIELWEQIVGLTDQVLLGLIAAYEQHNWGDGRRSAPGLAGEAET